MLPYLYQKAAPSARRWLRLLALAAAASTVHLPVAHAQAGKAAKVGEPAFATFLDAAAAGPDFPIQGEYSGEIAGGAKLAAQVVALGEGRFNVGFLAGGLPGAGWDGKTRTLIAAARTGEGQAATVTLVAGADAQRRNAFDGTISAGTLSGKTAEGKAFSLKKVERHSPNEGLKPPPGALVLFDGTNAEQWVGAKIVEGNLVEGNLLNSGTRTRKAFGDLKIHVEFRLPFMPATRGQARGNSGIKLQERYEIQVLDSFGLSGEKNECGAVYTQTRPLVNMCLPPLAWQTYDIDFKAARHDAMGQKIANAVVSVVHNGVEVQHEVEIKGKTGASKPEGPAPGALELQNHGNPIVYRNVWVVEPQNNQ